MPKGKVFSVRHVELVSFHQYRFDKAEVEIEIARSGNCMKRCINVKFFLNFIEMTRMVKAKF